MSTHSPAELAARVRRHLLAVQDRYPRAWRQFASFREARGVTLPRWPDWCWAPMAAAYAIVSGGGANRVPPSRLGDIAAVAALGAWRQGQGIYRVDADLAAGRAVAARLQG